MNVTGIKMIAEKKNEDEHCSTTKASSGTSNRQYCRTPFIKWTETWSQLQGNNDMPSYSVEPVVFMSFLASTLTSTVTQKLLSDRVCQRDLGLSQDQCLLLNQTEKNYVQPQVANLLTVKALLENLVPAIMTVYLGPWSDNGGRLPLLMYPLIGYGMTYTLYGVLSMQKNLAPQYFLPASIPLGLSGGFISVLAGSNSYIADVFPDHKRSFRLGIVDACIYMSLLIGNASITPLLEAIGFVGVYMTAAAICLTSFLYVLFFVRESVPVVLGRSEHSCTSCCFFGEIFQGTMVRDMIFTCIQWRPNKGRIILFLVISAITISDVAMEGESIVYYLFTNKKFGWEIKEYSLFASMVILSKIIAMVTVLRICSTKKISLSYSTVAAFCYLTKLVGSFITAVAPNVWVLYLGCAVGLFSGVAVPLCRTIIAKTVPGKDIGKIFSVTAATEALTPLLAATIYTQVYSGTISSFPSAFFFVSALIFLTDTTLLGIVAYLQSHQNHDYVPI